MRQARHDKNVADFWSLVDKRGPTECWPWKGKLDSYGYGMFTRRPYGQRAHQWAYALAGLKVPPGHELDHTCRLKCCANHAHLEAVTHAENTRRAISLRPKKEACPKGHPYSGDNLYVNPKTQHRSCRTCMRLATTDWLNRKRSSDPRYIAKAKSKWRKSLQRVLRSRKKQGVG